MIESMRDCVTLNNGVKMPWLGFGVFEIPEGEEVEAAVLHALEAGYRSIDTAGMYGNEAGVGRAIRCSGIPREDIFITTKVANKRQGFEETLAAFSDSLKLLEMEYVDLYLIHRAVKGKYPDTWRALEKVYREGYTRSIGVSNFFIHHLEDIRQISDIVPVVNQVEYHPYLTEAELHNYCREHSICLEAWSPLVRGQIFEDEVIAEIAGRYGKTMAQVVLRWDLQNEVITIPRSTKKARILENADIFDFRLSSEDMERINALNRDRRIGPNPDNY